ncbi:restriction endonuclease subunit M [Bacteroidales bacterium]|nr:restriction endonuclease subunit M [Bacteroidales bacterium]
MIFNKAYNREDFLNFLKRDFLPDDFEQQQSNIVFASKPNYSQSAIKLGVCKSLDLVVYEVQHIGKEDPRVGLSKEAFRMLSEEWQDRALILFVPTDNPASYRFSLIEIKLEGNEDDAKVNRKYSNPRRYSYLLGEGIGGYTPNKYLAKGKVKDEKDLQERFSVEILTKAFYNELSDWYAWAIDTVCFPGEQNLEPYQKQEHRSKNVIRLLIRLLFVWFLKQKDLIPWQLFDQQYLSESLIKDFSPNLQIGIFKSKSTYSIYYKAILQNLFFATLNCPITPQNKEDSRERGFRKKDWYGQEFGQDSLMRYQELFSNPQHFVDLVNERVPFLNGGLFDCLDDKEHKTYIDGFSDNLIKPNQLAVPDFLFFGETQGKGKNLSDFYGDKKKKKSDVLGLIDILKKYNFAIEENTPFDKEISLDPELLGKVFENLLASYNPETKTTARKQTGSFYTPREIVQYMVDESLVAHLKRTVGEEHEEDYRKLMRYTDEDCRLQPNKQKEIIKSLQNCKVLDPACGSGAFPVGVLQQMVNILLQLDERNEIWKDLILENRMEELGSTLKDCTQQEREEIQADINRSFDDSVNRPDYARKLYLIENCIYGVDIQSIAVQISKLRFFISLVVDQKPNKDAKDNFGIRPLPNLEAKFAAANTLIGLKKREASLFDNQDINKLQEKLVRTSHRIFGAKSNKTKNKYKSQVEDLQGQIAEKLEDLGAIGNDDAHLMRQWRMFDQNASSPFFDPWWMFGVKDGFDIVIGNPPYMSAVSMARDEETKKTYKKLYPEATGAYDIYILFLIKGLSLTKGSFIWIIPNKFLVADYAAKTKNKLIKYGLYESVDVSNFEVFETASVYPIILSGNNCEVENSEVENSGFKEYLLANYIDLSERRFITPMQVKKNPTLKEFGVKVRSGTTGFEAQKIKELICTDYKQDSIPFTVSGNIDRYTQNNDGVRYMGDKYVKPYIKKTNVIADAKWKFWCEPKIVIAGMTKHIEAVYVDTPLAIGVGAYAIYDFSGLHPLYLLGLLNSRYTTHYLRIKFRDKHLAGGYLAINKTTIEQLPVIDTLNQQPFIDLVDTILAAKKIDPATDTSALEAEIDTMVYELYGLTEKEIEVIENKQ